MTDEHVNAGTPPVINTMVMPWFMGMPWVPKFSGEGSQVKFRDWKIQIEAMLRAQGLSEAQKTDFIIGALDGVARREVLLLEDAKRNSATEILKALDALYSKTKSLAQIRVQFFKCVQGEGESIGAYVLRLRELFLRWREKEPRGSAQDETTVRDQFILGLRSVTIQRELQRLVRREDEFTFSDACAEARALEADHQEVDHLGEEATTSRVRAQHSRETRGNDLEKWKETFRAEVRQDIKDQISALSKDIAEEVRRQLSPAPFSPAFGRRTPGRPQSAGARYSASPRDQPDFQWDSQGRPICILCKKAGHVKRNCPEALNYNTQLPSGR